MVSQPATPNPPAQTGAPASQSVASGNAPGQSPSGPASPSAVVTVPLFGGKRGGKTRQDGLVPGSLEAIEADKKKDRERKAAARAVAAKLVAPPPLPAAAPGMVAAPVPPPAGAEPVSVNSAVETVATWTADDLREVFDELVPAAEEELTGRLLKKAQTANLPEKLVKEIGKDSAWSSTTKKALVIGGSSVSAKYLNKSGISSEYKSEVVLALALTRIATSHLKMSRRLDALILEQRKANLAAQAEAAKK